MCFAQRSVLPIETIRSFVEALRGLEDVPDQTFEKCGFLTCSCWTADALKAIRLPPCGETENIANVGAERRAMCLAPKGARLRSELLPLRRLHRALLAATSLLLPREERRSVAIDRRHQVVFFACHKSFNCKPLHNHRAIRGYGSIMENKPRLW